MKPRPGLLIDTLIYVSVYALLVVLVIITLLGTGLLLMLVPRVSELAGRPADAARTRRLAVLPTIDPDTPRWTYKLAIPAGQPAGSSQEQTITSVNAPAPVAVSHPVAHTARIVDHSAVLPVDPQPQAIPVASAALPEMGSTGPAPLPSASPIETDEVVRVPPPTRVRRPRPTPAPAGAVSGLVSSLQSAISGSNPGPPTRRTVAMPTLTPSPTGTETPTATLTPIATGTPLPTHTPSPTMVPTATNTPLPTDTPRPAPLPPPTATPAPTFTPWPDYDYLLAEFYNSPTANSFLLIYVAIVDPKEAPIGGMKVVGTRLDHNLTYDSPLSTWHYEGHSAPGKSIKSGNVKFEPPGGLETTSWVLYLADAQGNRMSAEVPFDVDANDKQWYFIKFRRK